MTNWQRRAIAFLRAEDGPTTVEYAVMLALVVALCLPSMHSIGCSMNRIFVGVISTLQTAS